MALDREVNGIQSDLKILRENLAVELKSRQETRQRELEAQNQLFQMKLDGIKAAFDHQIAGINAATELRLATILKVPEDINKAVGHHEELQKERFASIAQQFNERDIRTEQAGKASTEALAAALQAAKELVGAQGEASAAAAIKSETSFTKQIDQIGTIIQTLEKALDARITELKERIDRGEGNNTGAAAQRGDSRANVGMLVGILGLLFGVALAVIARL